MESKLKKGDVLICEMSSTFEHYIENKEYQIIRVVGNYFFLRPENGKIDKIGIGSPFHRDHFKLKPSTPKPVKDFKYKRKPKPVKVKKYEPKVGEWYKMTGWDYGKGIFCPTGFINSLELKRFGFTYNEGEFITISKTLIPTTCYKADPKEVLFSLTREAEKRGYKEGVKCRSWFTGGIGLLNTGSHEQNCWDEEGFHYMGMYILNTKGEWAEIIESEKPNVTEPSELEQSKQLVIDLQKQLDTATNEMLKAQSEVSKLKKLANDFYLENLQLINKDLEHKKLIMKQLNNH